MTIDEAEELLKNAYPDTWIDIAENKAIKPNVFGSSEYYWTVMVSGMYLSSKKSLEDCVKKALKFRLMEL